MKTLSFHYFDEGNISTYEFQYPDDRELLEIFPEAAQIIPQKIQDWIRAKGKLLCKETIPYFKKCNALKDEFAKAFWKEAYRYCAERFNEIMGHLKRLQRLQNLLADPEGTKNSAVRLQRAKGTSILEVFDFIKLRRVGKHHIACCPIHNEKTPSFYIYSDNTWHCFGCNKHGDAIDLAQAVHNLAFHEAIKFLVGGVK